MSTNPQTRLDVSPPNCAGKHVIRWIEDRDWGANTLVITTCSPEGLDEARADYAAFCLVPEEKRNEAARAVRYSSQPARVVLRPFIEASPATQPSLF